MVRHLRQLKKYDCWLIIALSVVILIIFVSPHVKAFRLQTKAGQVIADYVATVEQNQEQTVSGTFFCLFATMYPEPSAENDLDQAIAWLNEAKVLSPGNIYSNFLLGQASCLKGDYYQAIDELEEFIQKRSGNTLAVAELGFAKLSAYSSYPDSQQLDDESENVKLLLEQAGFGAGFLESTGEKAYKQGNYQYALAWFNMAEKIAPLSEANGRKHALLKVFLGGANNSTIDMPAISFSDHSDELIIEPDILFQINNGQPAKTIIIGVTTAAVITSNNNAIGVNIFVEDTSQYCLNFLAIDQKPEPTLLAVYMNYKKILDIELTEGDGQIKKFTIPVEMEKGISLISMKLLNDYYIANEIDRNGYIASVIVSQCQSN